MNATEIKALQQIAKDGPIMLGGDIIGVKNGRVNLRTLRAQGLIQLTFVTSTLSGWTITPKGEAVLAAETHGDERRTEVRDDTAG